MHKNNIHGQTVMRIWSCFAVCKIKIIWILFMTFSTDIYDFSIQKSPLIPGYDVLRDSFTLSFDLLTVYKFPWEQLVSPTPIIACGSSVLLSSYRNMSFNQSACIFSQDCFLNCDKTLQACENIRKRRKKQGTGKCFLHFSSALRCHSVIHSLGFSFCFIFMI